MIILPKLPHQSVIRGNQGRNLEVEAEAEAMEDCGLLACAQDFLSPLLYCAFVGHSP